MSGLWRSANKFKNVLVHLHTTERNDVLCGWGERGTLKIWVHFYTVSHASGLGLRYSLNFHGFVSGKYWNECWIVKAVMWSRAFLSQDSWKWDDRPLPPPCFPVVIYESLTQPKPPHLPQQALTWASKGIRNTRSWPGTSQQGTQSPAGVSTRT